MLSESRRRDWGRLRGKSLELSYFHIFVPHCRSSNDSWYFFLIWRIIWMLKILKISNYRFIELKLLHPFFNESFKFWSVLISPAFAICHRIFNQRVKLSPIDQLAWKEVFAKLQLNRKERLSPVKKGRYLGHTVTKTRMWKSHWLIISWLSTMLPAPALDDLL